MLKNHDSWDFRRKGARWNFLSKKEGRLMEILMEFGASIDPQGYDDGDYKTAVKAILKAVK